MEDNPRLKRLVTGGILVLVGAVLSKILTYLFRIIVGRTGIENYGLFMSTLAIYGVVTTLASFGLYDGVIRYVSYYRGKENYENTSKILTKALLIGGFLSIILAVLQFFLAKPIAINWFNTPELEVLIKIMAFAVPFEVLGGMFLSYYKGMMLMRYYVYPKNILENLLKVLLAFFVISLGFGIAGVTYSYMATIVITFLILLFLFLNLKGETKIKFFNFNFEFTGKLLAYSWPLLLSSISIYFISWTDSLMLGHFKAMFDVGIYNAALSAILLLSFFPFALMSLFFPMITERLAVHDKNGFQTMYKTATRWIFMFNLAIISLLFIFPKQVIMFMFGKEYIVSSISLFGQDFNLAALTLSILAVGFFPAIMLTTSHKVIMSMKKTKYVFGVTAIAALLNIILNLILIPEFGTVGAAVASATTYLFEFVAWLIGGYLVSKINPLDLNYVKYLIAAVLAALSTRYISLKYISPEFIFNLILLGGFFCAIYGILIIIFRLLTKEDIMILKSMKSIISK